MRNKRVYYETKNRDLGFNSDSAICSSGNYLDLWVLFFPFKIQQYLGFPCLPHRALEVKQSDAHTAFQTLKMVAIHRWWQFPLLMHLIHVIFMPIPFPLKTWAQSDLQLFGKAWLSLSRTARFQNQPTNFWCSYSYIKSHELLQLQRKCRVSNCIWFNLYGYSVQRTSESQENKTIE